MFFFLSWWLSCNKLFSLRLSKHNEDRDVFILDDDGTVILMMTASTNVETADPACSTRFGNPPFRLLRLPLSLYF